MTDWINDLERLRALREAGHMTDPEFEAAKARVLALESPAARDDGKQTTDEVDRTPASLAQSNPSSHEIDDRYLDTGATHDHEHPRDGARSHGKRLLLGVLVLVFVASAVLWILGGRQGPLFGSPNERVAGQCLGLRAGGSVMRPYEVTAGRLTSLLNSDSMKVLNPSTVDERWVWSAEGGGLFTLTGTTTDGLTNKQVATKWSFRELEGTGGYKKCGPNTLAFEREVVDGRDTGEEGAGRAIMAMGMAAGFATGESTPGKGKLEPSPETLTATPASASPAPAPSETFTQQELDEAVGPVRFMTGSWVAKGNYCASGDGINLNPGGVVAGEEGNGKWKYDTSNVNGGSLTITFPGPAERPQEGAVTWLGPDEVTIKWSDNQSDRWRRCPGDGSREPWFPS